MSPCFASYLFYRKISNLQALFTIFRRFYIDFIRFCAEPEDFIPVLVKYEPFKVCSLLSYMI